MKNTRKNLTIVVIILPLLLILSGFFEVSRVMIFSKHTIGENAIKIYAACREGLNIDCAAGGNNLIFAEPELTLEKSCMTSDDTFFLMESCELDREATLCPVRTKSVLKEEELGRGISSSISSRAILCSLSEMNRERESVDSCSPSEVSESYIDDFMKILPGDAASFGNSDELIDSMVGPEALLREILAAATGRGGEIFSFLLLLVGGVALIALPTLACSKMTETASTCVSILVVSVILGKVSTLFGEITDGIHGLTDFFSLFIPIATGIQVSSGAVGAAAAGAVGMNITVSVLSGLGSSFFVTLAGFGLSIGVVASFGDESALSLAKGVKSFFLWGIGLVCALIMGALALQTFIASAKDSAAMRAAKYAATSLIPVVGGTVSGAMATLATGLSYAKSVIGVGAIAVIITTFLSPLVTLVLYRTALSAMYGVSGFLGIGRAERCLGAVRSSFDLFIAVYSIAIVVCIFEIALFLMCGASVT